MLKLNESKTEVMFFSSKQCFQRIDGLTLNIGATIIAPKPSVRNLGVCWDTHFTMATQVKAISKSCNYQLRNISRIRHYITEDACRTLVNALVTSRLDYGNVLLHGASSSVISQLQRVQNSAARIITRTPKSSHITPVLQHLHWLPVDQRIRFKVLLHAYKAMNDLSPAYIQDLLDEYVPPRPLRSASKSLLCVPKYKTMTFGNRCFKNSAPALWNALPQNGKCAETVAIFKRRLKTHLFKLVYVT